MSAPALFCRQRLSPRRLLGHEDPSRSGGRRALHQAFPGEYVTSHAATGAATAGKRAHITRLLRSAGQRPVPYPRGCAAHVARWAALLPGSDHVDASSLRGPHVAGVSHHAGEHSRAANGLRYGSRYAGCPGGGSGPPHRRAERERAAALRGGHSQCCAAHAPLVPVGRRGIFHCYRAGREVGHVCHSEGPARLPMAGGQRPFWRHLEAGHGCITAKARARAADRRGRREP
mmetsp:Transcript_53131/g.114890  ORF Transcript_53131/g.114890 Transcript_53131/m.114890 type:complete len:231 (+) Transcript_53131:120-812(+)